MGSHTFTWAHAAQDVYVTGTFDNWSKSVKLEKSGNVFSKTVDLPAEKTFYKFVVDGTWTTDHSANQETDPSGNLNNVLQSHDISSNPSSSAAAFLSSAAPHSTSAALAGEQPLENSREEELPLETPGDDLPGAFPITPMNDLQQFSVNPIPATEGNGNPIKLAPGEPVPHPSTFTNNTVESTVRSDPDLKGNSKDDYESGFGVAPIPATEGLGNPIHLQPGEPVPHPSTLTSNTVDSTVRSDPDLKGNSKDDYESAFGVAPIPATGGLGNPIHLQPGEPVPHPSTLTRNTVESTVRDGAQYGVSDTGAPVLPPVLDSQDEAEANGAAMFGIPPVGSGLIPESSLPMGGSSREPSYEPSFTTSSVAPHSTTAQLAGQVPLEPRGVPQVVSDSQHAAHVGPEAASSAEAVHDKSAVEEELKQRVPEEPSTAESGPITGVPEVVSDSQHSAHVGPEAAGSPEAVREKAAVEEELKQKVPKESSTSDSIIPEAVAGGAAAAGATLIGAALLAKDKATEAYSSTTEPTPSSKAVPDVVSESQQAAHASPEASASPLAVREKAQFEDELKHAIPKAPATSESGLLGNSEAGLTGKIAAGATAAGAAVAGAAYLARDKATEAYSASTEPTSSSKAVPEVVSESQQAAHASPEASASPLAVGEKAQFEDELKHVVPEAPATSESGLLGNSEAGFGGKIAAGATAAGAAVAGAAYLARDKASDAYTSAAGQPPSAIFSEPTVDGSVPSVVTESQEKAHVSPEASANPEAVREKVAFENELQSEVGKAPATSESGVFGKSEQGISGKAAAGIAAGTAAVGATAAGAAYTARDKAAETTGSNPHTFLPPSVQSAIDNMNNHTAPLPTGTFGTTSNVPEAVVESQHEAHVSPEASAEPEAVAEKSQMEKELLDRVPTTNESGVPAPTESAALTETAPVNPVPSETFFLGGSSADKSATPTGVTAVTDTPPVTSSTAVPQTETSTARQETGLNAPADSQAQTFATKNDQLAAPQLAAPATNEHSRDVSPMTRPESQPQTTTGVDSETVPATSTGGPTTPQKANKRASSFFRNTNTPDSVKTSNSEASNAVDKGSKRKGFLAKLKEKFRG